MCPDDQHLLDTATKVARRYFCYGGYGSRRGALAALRRRAPGFEPAQYEAALDLLVQVYEVAKTAIANNITADGRAKGASDYADFVDIDFDAALAQLDTVSPGFAVAQKKQVLSWAILYWYLM